MCGLPAWKCSQRLRCLHSVRTACRSCQLHSRPLRSQLRRTECGCCDMKAVAATYNAVSSNTTNHTQRTRTHLSQKWFVPSCHTASKQANKAIRYIAGIITRDRVGEIGYPCFAKNSLRLRCRGQRICRRKNQPKFCMNSQKDSMRYRVRSNHFATNSCSNSQMEGVNSQDQRPGRCRFCRSNTW